MLVKPDESLEGLKEREKTLLTIMGSPFCDHLAFIDCSEKLEAVRARIVELENDKT